MNFSFASLGIAALALSASLPAGAHSGDRTEQLRIARKISQASCDYRGCNGVQFRKEEVMPHSRRITYYIDTTRVRCVDSAMVSIVWVGHDNVVWTHQVTCSGDR